MGEEQDISLKEHNLPSYNENYINRDAVAQGLPVTPIVPSIPSENGIPNGVTFADIWNSALAQGGPNSTQPIPLTSFSNSPRYPKGTRPGDNWEEGYAQQQSWSSKMMSGLGKGLSLTATTFLQTTAGAVNGVIQAKADGRAASFYDNDFNRALDEFNKNLEDTLPNYYTEAERNARWYSPSKLFSANFLWDGIVKNLGFSAGAALSGLAFASILKAIPISARLFSAGKAAETLATAEAAALEGGGGYGQIKALSDSFLGKQGLYNSLNKGQRILVAGLATTGEAGFEAFHNLNEFRDAKMQEYRDEHNGQNPTGNDLQAINQAADAVGNSSSILNTILLSGTNYIQFPRILGSSYTAEKGIANSLTKEIRAVVKEGGKYIEKVPTTFFGKGVARINRIRPYLFSASEGFEEGAQFAITKGTEDYYNKKYNNEDTDFMESLVEGVRETLGSDEGMENILIGGLSGTLMIHYFPTLLGRGPLQKNRKIKENTANALTAFNKFKFSDFTKETFDGVNRGIVLQKEREELLKSGNIAESKDKEADYVINYLTPKIKYGRFDLVKSEIDEYRTLANSDEGWRQLVEEGKVTEGDTKEKYLQRLAKFEQTAENVKSLYQSLNIRYGNLINEKGEPLYSSAVIDKMIYSASKIADYDVRIPELSTKLISIGIDTTQLISDLTDNKIESFNEAKTIINSYVKANNLTNDQKEDLTEALEDVGYMAIMRDEFVKEYNDIKEFPTKHQEVTKTPVETPVEEKEILKVKTKRGLKNVEIGEDYVVGRFVKYDEFGNEVIQAPIIQILGENEDGTIKIKDKNGERNITKKTLESWNLVKLSAIKEDPTRNFVYINRNNLFKHKGIKDEDGNPVIGQIEYDPAKDKRIFVYKSKNGKILRKEVWNSLFEAQKGYREAVITKEGKLTVEEEEVLDAFTKEKLAISEKLRKRNQIITDLYENSVKRLEQINERLNNSDRILERTKAKIEKEISEALLTKAGKQRKRPNLALISNLTNSLARVHEDVQKENNQLLLEKEELEGNIPFFKDFLDNMESLPDGGADMVVMIRKDIKELETLIEITDDSIKKSESLLKQIQDLLSNALSLLNDYIKRLQEENPKIPLFIEDLISRVEKYLGDEGTKQYIEDRLGFTEQVMELQANIDEFSEELKVPALSKKVENLTKDISDLQEGLKELVNEQLAKMKILETFAEYAKEAKKIEEEEKGLTAALNKQLLKQKSESLQNNFYNTYQYEPESKKDLYTLVNSTRPTDANIPHQQRVDSFNFNLDTMPNREKLRTITATAKTEGEIIEGLTEHFLNDVAEGPKKETLKKEIIYEIVVDENNRPINEEGLPIEKDADLLTSAIYQVYPNNELKGKYGENYETSFRASDIEENPDEVAKLTKDYQKWRATQLKRTTLSEPREFDASFGYPNLVKTKDGKVDVNARTSAKDANLLPKSLSNDVLIVIPTKKQGNATEGHTVFKNAIGRVFLRIPGRGLAKLINRKFTKNEASVMFDVLHQITKNAQNEGGITDTSERLFTWLKSISYWGLSKEQRGKRKKGEAAGHNNIWFERVGPLSIPRLYIGRDESFDFTPSAMVSQKELIIETLQSVYNNVDSKMSTQDGWNSAYDEITGINEDGTPIIRTWINYQAYLLSDRFIDGKEKEGEGRNVDDIPLVTQYMPVTDSSPVNRTSTYFIVNNTNEDIENITPTKTSSASNVRDFGGIKYVIKDGEPVFDDNDISEDDQESSMKALQDIANDEFEGDMLKAYKEVTKLIKTYEGKQTKQTEQGPEVINEVIINDLEVEKQEQSLEVPEISLTFIPNNELIKRKHPIKSKKTQLAIKKELDKLNTILKCLGK